MTTEKKAVLWWTLGLPSAVFLVSFAALRCAAGVPQETSAVVAVILMWLGGVQALRMSIRVLNGAYVQKRQ